MDSTEKQEHARRIVAEYLDDNLEFSYVYEDEDLEDHEDAWRDIHNLCGEIIKDLRAVVKTGNLFTSSSDCVGCRMKTLRGGDLWNRRNPKTR